jgi:hypothetical protein
MPEYEAKTRAGSTADLLHDGMGPPAVGTLEVAILDQRDRGAVGTQAVVLLTNR